MAEGLSQVRFVLEDITDIATVEGHTGLPSLFSPHWDTLRIMIQKRTGGDSFYQD
jgi:hypothetical protein